MAQIHPDRPFDDVQGLRLFYFLPPSSPINDEYAKIAPVWGRLGKMGDMAG